MVGEAGLRELEKVCWVLDLCDVKVNESCGLHVHIDAAGFNMGMNQGKVGGAGIAAPLHEHVIPRWNGDTNFLPIVAGTKTVTQTLDEIRHLVAEAWPSDLANPNDDQ